jgi:hypothetical protein
MMVTRRKLHPNYLVNMRKAASDERKTSEAGYVVKHEGHREYFKSYKEARAYREKLIKDGAWSTHIQIVNIARQNTGSQIRNSASSVKKYLVTYRAGSKFYGNGLTGHELAHMVMGRMCEATSFVFKSAYATPEMRKIAQRALMYKVRNGTAIRDETVDKALKMKISTGGRK